VEFLKIVALCIFAAVVYGVLHDQVTARLCIEYFTVFHPPVFTTHSPTLLGLGWGVIATWWAGAIIGILLACAARFGARNQASARQLVRPVCWLMCFMGVCTLTFGVLGYYKGSIPGVLGQSIPAAKHQAFVADWWAHSASYGCGFLGGTALCLLVVYQRLRVGRSSHRLVSS